MEIIFNQKTNKLRRQTLRNSMPKAEIILWSKLKNKQLKNCKFRRQYGVGKYIIDFFCPLANLAIELDGESHFQDGVEKYDSYRQKYIESCGIRFLRFTNTEIYKNLNKVLASIEETLDQPPRSTTTPP